MPFLQQAPRMIRTKLEVGILPHAPMARMSVGGGRGESCDGCEGAILPTQVEYELDVSGRTLRFHRECAALWEAGRRQAPAA